MLFLKQHIITAKEDNIYDPAFKIKCNCNNVIINHLYCCINYHNILCITQNKMLHFFKKAYNVLGKAMGQGENGRQEHYTVKEIFRTNSLCWLKELYLKGKWFGWRRCSNMEE